MTFEKLKDGTIFESNNQTIFKKVSDTSYNILQTRFGNVTSFSEYHVRYQGYMHPIELRKRRGKFIHIPAVIRVIYQ